MVMATTDTDSSSTSQSGQVAQVSERLQLIDDTKTFSPDLGKFMKDQWQLATVGFHYNVVAVFGSQSTGKSTLLNRLFETKFPVMNEQSRQQTTKGIWLSRAKTAPILVMDVEGTDGRERGEHQEFERRSALFSLASSEVIIINIWENMVGLYNGANMGLLKTVFEVHLQLFHSEGAPKTLLFFVIRDHTGQTPMSNLQKVLLDSLQAIWNETNKPESLQTAHMHDYFDFAFHALPHKVFQAESFEKEVTVLRERFMDKSNEGYVFLEKYHKKIPADGVPHYMESIWFKIIENKDLDLPTQQQLLAQFRCDEIAKEIYTNFVSQLKPYESRIESGQVLDDFAVLGKLRDTEIASFAQEASRYHVDVFKAKKAELMEKMNTLMHVQFIGQLRNLQKSAINSYKKNAYAAIDKENCAELLEKAFKDAVEFFDKGASGSVLPNTDWSFEEDSKTFLATLEELASKLKKEEMEKLVKKLLKSLNHVQNELSSHFASANRDLWAQVLQLYSDSVEKFSTTFKQKTKAFKPSDEELSDNLKLLQEKVWESIRQKIREEVSDTMFQARLRQKFEETFRYDDHGLPKVWQQGENMDSHFVKAKERAEELIQLFSKISLTDEHLNAAITNDDDYDETTASIILIPAAKQRDLKDRLRKDADAIFLDIKRGAMSSLTEVPRAMWLALLFFGFNEIYTVTSYLLTNPFLLILTTLLAVVIAFLYQSGLLMPLAKTAFKSAGPGMSVIMATVGPTMETIRVFTAELLKQLSDNLNNPANQVKPAQVAQDSSSSQPQKTTSSSPSSPDRTVSTEPSEPQT